MKQKLLLENSCDVEQNLFSLHCNLCLEKRSEHRNNSNYRQFNEGMGGGGGGSSNMKVVGVPTRNFHDKS